MSKSEKRISEINDMINRQRELINKNYPAGHNSGDEDIAKVAAADVIGKAQNPTEVLKKSY